MSINTAQLKYNPYQIINLIRFPNHWDVATRAVGLFTTGFAGCAGSSLLLKKYTTKDERRHAGGRSLPNGESHGKGRVVFPNGGRYEGELLNGVVHGKGILFFPNGNRYEGQFLNGEMTGKGTCFFADGCRYEGQFLNGEMIGKVACFLPDGRRYEGGFLNNLMNGEGTFFFPNGDRYEGRFLSGAMTGKGTFFFANGNRYEGGFLEGGMDGKGAWINNIGQRLAVVYDRGACIEFSEEYANAAPSIYTGRTDPAKECAVVIESSFDSGQPFCSDADRARWINQIKTSGCPTRFICPPNFQSVMMTISQEMPIKILMIRAHGSSEKMAFGETDRVNISALQPLLNRLSKKPIIILESCHTGSSENILVSSRVIHRPSLAEQISLARPDATVIAPKSACNAVLNKINCTRSPETNTFTIEIQMFSPDTLHKIDRVFKGKEA